MPQIFLESDLSRWLLVFIAVAVLAAIAGFVTFGGGNMGH